MFYRKNGKRTCKNMHIYRTHVRLHLTRKNSLLELLSCILQKCWTYHLVDSRLRRKPKASTGPSARIAMRFGTCSDNMGMMARLAPIPFGVTMPKRCRGLVFGLHWLLVCVVTFKFISSFHLAGFPINDIVGSCFIRVQWMPQVTISRCLPENLGMDIPFP